MVINLDASEGFAGLSREIPAQGTCAELARAVAVVVAAWHLERHAPALQVQPQPSPPPPPPPRAAARVERAAPKAETSPPVTRLVELRVGTLAALSPAQASPAALVALAVSPLDGWQGGLIWVGPVGTSEQLGPSPVRVWQHHFGAELAATARITKRLRFGLQAMGGVTYTLAERERSDQSLSGATWVPLSSLGARIDWGKELGLWLGTGVAVWPQPLELRSQELGAARSLPRWQVWVSVGGYLSLGN